MSDLTLSLIAGERRPVYATASTPAPGTLALSGTPTFALTRGGASVIAATPCTGQSGGGTATVQVFYDLDTSTAGAGGTALAPGQYVGLFALPLIGSDGVTRTRLERALLTVEAASPGGGYPTAADLRDYLFAPGVVPADDISAPNVTPMQSLGLDGKVAAAIGAFERGTDYRPFLSDGTSQTRYFDNPLLGGVGLSGAFGTGRTLALFPGLLSDTTSTSVTTGVINGAGGTVRTPGTEWRLLPLNAPLDGLPYTHLQWGASGYFVNAPGYGYGGGGGYGGAYTFDGYDAMFFGQAGQISVTGVWGRTLSLDADDFDAILQYAAYLCYPQIALMVSKGLYGARDLNFEIRYAAGSEGSVSREAKAWKANFDAKVALRKREFVI